MKHRTNQKQWLMMTMACCLVAVMGVMQVGYAMTPAGTVIGNSATATYYDENNNEYTTTSNIVQTVVAEICGVDVTPEAVVTKQGIAGQTVYMPFGIENIGNGENTYTLALTGATAGPTYTIYKDNNQNGVVDGAESSTGSETITMDGTISIVVSVQLPAGATGTYTFNLNATGTAPGSCTDLEAGSITVINDALIQANKSVDRATVNALGETLTYTVSFKNIGTKWAKAHDGFTINGTAGTEGILVFDEIPAGSSFVTTSASGIPTANPAGYAVYSADGSAWFNTEAGAGGAAAITHVGFFMPDSLPANDIEGQVLDIDQQGTFTFKVTVNDPFDDTDKSVDNDAVVTYSNDTGVEQNTTTNEVHTSIPASVTADVSAGGLDGWAFGTSWTTVNVNPTAEEDGVYNDDNYYNNGAAGTWIEFLHQAKNNDLGNSDIIDLAVDLAAIETDMPNNYIVEFWNADGTAKLLDSDNDGRVDLGTVAAGGTEDFTVKVFIPANTATETLDGTVDYFVTIIAYSSNNGTELDRSRDNIDGIIASGVDIAESGEAGDNDDEAAPYGDIDHEDDVTATVAPGITAIYPLQIVNTGVSSDSFQLTAANNPAGTTVSFYMDADCDGLIEAGDGQFVNTPLMGGTTLTAAAAAATVLSVNDVANFIVGDTVIVGLNGTTMNVTAVNVANQTITVDAAVTAAVGALVSEVKCFVMSVNTQADTPAATTIMTVTATSSNSSTSNSLDAQLIVSELCSVAITPDGSDQVPQNGTTTYLHTVTNTSNVSRYVTIGYSVVAPEDLQYTFIAVGTNTWYNVGVDGDAGTADDGLALADGATAVMNNTVYVQLAAGASAQFKVKVFVPSSVPAGSVEAASITAVADGDGNFDVITDQCTATAADTTTVIEGYLQLSKTVTEPVASGTDDNSIVAGACNDAADTIVPAPCDLLTYSIQYKNIGQQDALNVVITDMIPNYSWFETGTLGLDANCDGDLADVGDATYTDAAADDLAECDVPGTPANSTLVRFRVGTGATAAAGGTVTPGGQGCVMFKVRIQ